jgi:hypothetical protein
LTYPKIREQDPSYCLSALNPESRTLEVSLFDTTGRKDLVQFYDFSNSSVAGHLAKMRETRNANRLSVGKLLENSYLENRKGDGKMTLRWISWIVSLRGSR